MTAHIALLRKIEACDDAIEWDAAWAAEEAAARAAAGDAAHREMCNLIRNIFPDPPEVKP